MNPHTPEKATVERCPVCRRLVTDADEHLLDCPGIDD